ncbi:sugar ABC transporter substrate-binding protein [Cryobacterium roopkundense]|uniref:ABC-type sugar transport system substrate-binding protein n=1 Tax=Cryobacterium roopkundense TaxID=1001240 RepID=A0A7W8ZX71_9MICO|nr:substrate-binding domain-containing protein [Cryobacterium roopkundense]MBB5641876.1 ABC-type sugar transport system substrate-binding protein [Cryobacterium roopkundense]
MNWKKQSLAVIAAGAIALSLTACNRGDGTASADGATAQSAALVISTLNNPFFVSVAAGAKAQAAELGMTLDIQNANNVDQTALDMTTTALTKQPDVLIIDPIGSESGASMTRQANQSGAPVVAFDRQPASGDLASFIGYDAIAAGRAGAKSLGEALGGTGTVVEIQGILGTNVAQDRSQGFTEGIAEFPGITVVAVQSADFDRGKALDVMTDILQANPGIAGVYAANDEMALGVVAALDAQGLAGTVKVVGNDGIADALTAIAAGTMYSTNAESPFALGKSVVSIASKVASGETVEEKTVLTGRLVTEAGIADFCSYLSDEGDTDTCATLK